MAFQGHLLAGGRHQHQLSGLQGELRLGIGHGAGACLGHKNYKGIGTGQVKGLGAIHTDGLHIAAVVESVLIHQLGTDRGGIVYLGLEVLVDAVNRGFVCNVALNKLKSLQFRV